MIRYVYTIEGVTARQLKGFFGSWSDPPSPATHLKLLQGSDVVVLAVDDESGSVVGFITAITDHVLSAYVPLLEVVPEYRGKGIGKELVQRMLDRLGNLYMIDLMCDPALQPFYASFGMRPATGMMIRNYERQAGRAVRRRRGAG